jgi:hypothetical protein
MAHESQKGEALILNLAKTTKQDSGTMKLIALITMFYLPGTFVAVRDSSGVLYPSHVSAHIRSSLSSVRPSLAPP